MARSARVSRPQPTELPPYQPSAHQLTPGAQRSLYALKETHSLRKLKAHVSAANGSVTETAGEINDLLVQAEGQQRRRRARCEKEGLEMEEDERDENFLKRKQDIEAMTDEMEASTRKLIDVDMRAIAMEDVLKELDSNASTGGAPRAGRQPSHRMVGRRRNEEDQQEDVSDEYMESLNEEDHQQGAGPVESFQKGLRTRRIGYERQSQREKYATHNNYIGFKRIIHDALNPGEDAPPVLHPDTWFPASPRSQAQPSSPAGDSTRRTRQNRRAAPRVAADDSDDDIAIAREKTSLKCPITLLAFRDPVTSKKCPHSFEKEAIVSMITQSGARVGGSRRGDGEKAVKCPVCEQMLTKDDLYSDHLLIRRIKRLEESLRDSNSNDSDGDEDHHPNASGSAPRGTQHNVLEEDTNNGSDGVNANDFGADVDGFADDGD